MILTKRVKQADAKQPALISSGLQDRPDRGWGSLHMFKKMFEKVQK